MGFTGQKPAKTARENQKKEGKNTVLLTTKVETNAQTVDK